MENNVKVGEPVNTKSLLAFVFNQMGKLDRDEITTEKAIAQSKLVAQARGILDYELKRTIVQTKIYELSGHLEKDRPKLREVESKGFDNTI